MYYGSLPKSKFGTNIAVANKTIKQKDNLFKGKVKNNNTLVVDKDIGKSVINSYRPGIINGVVTTGKFRTSKNSRKDLFLI
jgi:hypothetical protein